MALWGGREIAGVVLASLVAGFATTPYAAYHFHRLAPYGVLANLLAMPVVSVWVMPMGILGVLTLPFGFDAVFWQLMGEGIDWMIAVALWVAQLPGAVGHIHAFGTGPLLLATAGLLLLCLLRTPLRWSGAALAIAAVLWAVATPRPDVLVVGRRAAAAAAWRATAGCRCSHSGRDTFAIKEWLLADGDGRTPKDASLRDGVHCDAIGCIGRLTDGRLVSMALSAEAFAEDCARAAVVVSPREAPACAAMLIDRKVWRAMAPSRCAGRGDRFEQSAARPAGYERPWARRSAERNAQQRGRRRPTRRRETEDLEAGD